MTPTNTGARFGSVIKGSGVKYVTVETVGTTCQRTSFADNWVSKAGRTTVPSMRPSCQSGSRT